MKIKVNYDLIEKIRESKTGVSLKRSSKRLLLTTSLVTALNVPAILMDENPMNELRYCLTIAISVGLFYRIVYDGFLFKDLYKNKSLSELKNLAQLLRGNFINTDYELLQKAYQYETNYSFTLDGNKIPRLKQEKYIMVPVTDRDGEKEVSLVQEHLIGTSEYELSYGSPKKVLKPAVSFGY